MPYLIGLMSLNNPWGDVMQNQIKVFTKKPTIRKELKEHVNHAYKLRKESTIYVEYEEVDCIDHFEWNVQAVLYVENDYVKTWTWKELIGLTAEEWLDDYSELQLYRATCELWEYLCEALADEDDWCRIVRHSTMQRV